MTDGNCSRYKMVLFSYAQLQKQSLLESQAPSTVQYKNQKYKRNMCFSYTFGEYVITNMYLLLHICLGLISLYLYK